MTQRPRGRPAHGLSDGAAGRIRIIGGRWRGTRLDVAGIAGLRPSADRVRETLFNWLAPALPGARVLDLFAGTGALGIEAVSRGAAGAVLVERDATAVAALRATAARLQGGDALQVVQADALSWLASQPAQAFDIAFVDPPFAADLWQAAAAALERCLAPDAWVYVESPVDGAWAPPATWTRHREGSTREVRFALYRRRAAVAEGTATLPSNSGSDDVVSE